MNHRRRLSDKLRMLADKAWSRGSKDVAADLHDAARKEEARRSRPS